MQGTLLTREELQGWAASNEQLLVTEGRGRSTWTEKRVARMDLATGSLDYLTAASQAALAPALSPDGETIAYVSGPDIGPVGGGLPRARAWPSAASG